MGSQNLLVRKTPRASSFPGVASHPTQLGQTGPKSCLRPSVSQDVEGDFGQPAVAHPQVQHMDGSPSGVGTDSVPLPSRAQCLRIKSFRIPGDLMGALPASQVQIWRWLPELPRAGRKKAGPETHHCYHHIAGRRAKKLSHSTRGQCTSLYSCDTRVVTRAGRNPGNTLITHPLKGYHTQSPITESRECCVIPTDSPPS